MTKVKIPTFYLMIFSKNRILSPISKWSAPNFPQDQFEQLLLYKSSRNIDLLNYMFWKNPFLSQKTCGRFRRFGLSLAVSTLCWKTQKVE